MHVVIGHRAMVVWDLGNHLKLKSMPDSFHDSDREMSPGTVTVTVMCNGLKSYLEEYSCFWLLTCHFTYCKVANSTTFCLVTPVDLFNKSLQNAPIWGPSRACVQAGPALYHMINKNTRTWDKRVDEIGTWKSSPKIIIYCNF